MCLLFSPLLRRPRNTRKRMLIGWMNKKKKKERERERGGGKGRKKGGGKGSLFVW